MGNPTQTFHAYHTHPLSGASDPIFAPLHYDTNYESHAVAIFQGGLAHPHSANGPIPHLGSIVVTLVPESPQANPSQSNSIASAVSPAPSSPGCFLSPPVGGAACATVSPIAPATLPAVQPSASDTPQGSDTGAICGSEAAGAIDPAVVARVAAVRARFSYMDRVRDRAEVSYPGVPLDHVLFAIDREADSMHGVGLDVSTPPGPVNLNGLHVSTPLGPVTSSPVLMLNSAGDPYGTVDRDREVYQEYDLAAQAAAADGPASASVAGFGMSVISVGLPEQRQTHSSFFHLVFGLAYCEDVPLPGVLQTVPGGTATAAQVSLHLTIYPRA